MKKLVVVSGFLAALAGCADPGHQAGWSKVISLVSRCVHGIASGGGASPDAGAGAP